ncbi:hypothetical protein XELAEV_18000888mg [Xenopus laevis]|nr:hypothetical protein XELAEV_18000888mg [Xenopus laevis]
MKRLLHFIYIENSPVLHFPLQRLYTFFFFYSSLRIFPNPFKYGINGGEAKGSSATIIASTATLSQQLSPPTVTLQGGEAESWGRGEERQSLGEEQSQGCGKERQSHGWWEGEAESLGCGEERQSRGVERQSLGWWEEEAESRVVGRRGRVTGLWGGEAESKGGEAESKGGEAESRVVGREERQSRRDKRVIQGVIDQKQFKTDIYTL